MTQSSVTRARRGKRFRGVLFYTGLTLLLLVAAFVTLVGPWPTYSEYDVENSATFREAAQAIDAASVNITDIPGPLRAGWASRLLTPQKALPLAGYGDRQGAQMTGVHDDVQVKALALSDGADTVVVLGCDLLIVPQPIGAAVRENIRQSAATPVNTILFSASHTHCGPGAWGDDPISKLFAGEYDAEFEQFLVKQFTDAIQEAVASMLPASLAHASVEAPDLIRNRVRAAGTDPWLDMLLVQQDDGDRCYAMRYSAHATIMDGYVLEISAEYPGYAQRAIERETGGAALFLGGAVGAMSPVAPEGDTGFLRAEAMGEELARRALAAIEDAPLVDALDIAGVGVSFTPPSIQLRLDQIGLPGWRVSPWLPSLLGMDLEGWISAVRLGDVVIVGAPCDLSGEISIVWRDMLFDSGRSVWTTSFNGAYLGYISPDRYYTTADPTGREGYEMFTMSWCGPRQEAYFTALMTRMLSRLAP